MSIVKLKQTIKSIMPRSVFDLLKRATFFGAKIPNFEIYQSYVTNKRGLEIGGPSALFMTSLPLYQVVDSLDGVNFSNQTVWEGVIEAGQSFNYLGNKKGFQYISEATDLSFIKSATYDFLLSSNCLEHIANPLRAIEEWKRVLKSGSALVLVLPNKDSNFDHKRPVTEFQHLLDDLSNDISEHDLTHLDEILALHDLSMDPPAGNLAEFTSRSMDNFNNRTLHHHVFDISLIEMMLDYAGFEIVDTCTTHDDFLALALKTPVHR